MLPIQIIIHHTLFCLVVLQQSASSYVSNLFLPTLQILIFFLFLKTSPSISVCIQFFSPFWGIRLLNRNPSARYIFFCTFLLLLFTLCVCHLVLYYLSFHKVTHNKNNYSLLQISFYFLYCSTRFFMSLNSVMDNKRSYASVCAGLPAGLQAAPLPEPPQSSTTKRSRTYRSKQGRRYRASRKTRISSAATAPLIQANTSVQAEAGVCFESPSSAHVSTPLPVALDSLASFCAPVLSRILGASQSTLAGTFRTTAISVQVEANYDVREKSTRLSSRLPDGVCLSETPLSSPVMHPEPCREPTARLLTSSGMSSQSRYAFRPRLPKPSSVPTLYASKYAARSTPAYLSHVQSVLRTSDRLFSDRLWTTSLISPPLCSSFSKELPELQRYLQGPRQYVSLLGSQAPNITLDPRQRAVFCLPGVIGTPGDYTAPYISYFRADGSNFRVNNKCLAVTGGVLDGASVPYDISPIVYHCADESSIPLLLRNLGPDFNTAYNQEDINSHFVQIDGNLHLPVVFNQLTKTIGSPFHPVEVLADYKADHNVRRPFTQPFSRAYIVETDYTYEVDRTGLRTAAYRHGSILDPTLPVFCDRNSFHRASLALGTPWRTLQDRFYFRILLPTSTDHFFARPFLSLRQCAFPSSQSISHLACRLNIPITTHTHCSHQVLLSILVLTGTLSYNSVRTLSTYSTLPTVSLQALVWSASQLIQRDNRAPSLRIYCALPSSTGCIDIAARNSKLLVITVTSTGEISPGCPANLSYLPLLNIPDILLHVLKRPILTDSPLSPSQRACIPEPFTLSILLHDFMARLRSLSDWNSTVRLRGRFPSPFPDFLRLPISPGLIFAVCPDTLTTIVLDHEGTIRGLTTRGHTTDLSFSILDNHFNYFDGPHYDDPRRYQLLPSPSPLCTTYIHSHCPIWRVHPLHPHYHNGSHTSTFTLLSVPSIPVPLSFFLNVSLSHTLSHAFFLSASRNLLYNLVLYLTSLLLGDGSLSQICTFLQPFLDIPSPCDPNFQSVQGALFFLDVLYSYPDHSLPSLRIQHLSHFHRFATELPMLQVDSDLTTDFLGTRSLVLVSVFQDENMEQGYVPELPTYSISLSPVWLYVPPSHWEWSEFRKESCLWHHGQDLVPSDHWTRSCTNQVVSLPIGWCPPLYPPGLSFESPNVTSLLSIYNSTCTWNPLVFPLPFIQEYSSSSGLPYIYMHTIHRDSSTLTILTPAWSTSFRRSATELCYLLSDFPSQLFDGYGCCVYRYPDLLQLLMTGLTCPPLVCSFIVLTDSSQYLSSVINLLPDSYLLAYSPVRRSIIDIPIGVASPFPASAFYTDFLFSCLAHLDSLASSLSSSYESSSSLYDSVRSLSPYLQKHILTYVNSQWGAPSCHHSLVTTLLYSSSGFDLLPPPILQLYLSHSLYPSTISFLVFYRFLAILYCAADVHRYPLHSLTLAVVTDASYQLYYQGNGSLCVSYTVDPPFLSPGFSVPDTISLPPVSFLSTSFDIHAPKKSVKDITTRPVSPPSDPSAAKSDLTVPPSTPASAPQSLRPPLQQLMSPCKAPPLSSLPKWHELSSTLIAPSSDPEQLTLLEPDFFSPPPTYLKVLSSSTPSRVQRSSQPSHYVHFDLPSYSPKQFPESNPIQFGPLLYSGIYSTYQSSRFLLISRLPSNSSADLLTSIRDCQSFPVIQEIHYPVPQLSSLNESAALVVFSNPVLFAYPTNVCSATSTPVFPQVFTWKLPPSMGQHLYYKNKRQSSVSLTDCRSSGCECSLFSPTADDDSTSRLCSQCGHPANIHSSCVRRPVPDHLTYSTRREEPFTAILSFLTLSSPECLQSDPVWHVMIPTDTLLIHLYRAQLEAYLQLYTPATRSPFIVVFRTISMRGPQSSTSDIQHFVQSFFYIYVNQLTDLTTSVISNINHDLFLTPVSGLAPAPSIRLMTLNSVSYLWSRSFTDLLSYSASQGLCFSRLRPHRARVSQSTLPNINVLTILQQLQSIFLTIAPSSINYDDAEVHTLLPVVHNIASPLTSLRWLKRERVYIFVPSDSFDILFDDSVYLSTSFCFALNQLFRATSVSVYGNVLLWKLRSAMAGTEELVNISASTEVCSQDLLPQSLLETARIYYGQCAGPYLLASRLSGSSLPSSAPIQSLSASTSLQSSAVPNSSSFLVAQHPSSSEDSVPQFLNRLNDLERSQHDLIQQTQKILEVLESLQRAKHDK